jgi:hypothetical protein
MAARQTRIWVARVRRDSLALIVCIYCLSLLIRLGSYKLSALQNPAGINAIIIGGVVGAAGVVLMVAGVIAFRNRKNKFLRDASKLSSA